MSAAFLLLLAVTAVVSACYVYTPVTVVGSFFLAMVVILLIYLLLPVPIPIVLAISVVFSITMVVRSLVWLARRTINLGQLYFEMLSHF